MGIARSTYYDKPKGSADDTALVEVMHAIKDEFEAYGWRRMQAALRHRGWVVNHKKIKRLMREHALHPPRRRRFVATTDSDHDEPVFPDRSREREVDGPNQLWVADLTYIAILGGFLYLAAIMDAWSRRIVGYALGRRIDARLTLAALATAIEHRNPSAGCIHHSDRGSQYAAQAYRALLDEHGLVGSMGRRGNPYDNAMMESFMKTLKVEGVYPMAFESAEDVAEPRKATYDTRDRTPPNAPRDSWRCESTSLEHRRCLAIETAFVGIVHGKRDAMNDRPGTSGYTSGSSSAPSNGTNAGTTSRVWSSRSYRSSGWNRRWRHERRWRHGRRAPDRTVLSPPRHVPLQPGGAKAGAARRPHRRKG